jgi:phosphate starvation-inducible protein PhoH
MSKKKKSCAGQINKLNFELKEIEPLTDAQKSFFENYECWDNHLLMGSPGTGKTFLALHKAFQEVCNDSRYRRIIIVRSAVATRDIGFLPGNLQEKGLVYELPYKKIASELFGRGDAYEVLTKHDVIRFMLTSYIRGISLNNCIVIVDEFQNLSAHEAASILTRMGKNSKIMFCGDFAQTDLVKKGDQNVNEFVDIIMDMHDWFSINEFMVDDCVRSDLVRAFLKMQELRGAFL